MGVLSDHVQGRHDAHVNQLGTETVVFEQMCIVFEQFRCNGENPLQQFVQTGSLGDETWNIVAGRNPNAGLTIPFGSY